MHLVLILSGLLTLASAATIHMPARAPSGKDLFKRESEPVCWKEKYTMSVEVAEKILCTLKEKAEKGEQCCAKEKGQEVVCAADPAEEKEEKEGGGKKMRREEKEEMEEKETVSGLYLVTKSDSNHDQCIKAEALVEVVEKMIECCQSEAEGGSEEEKKKEEEEKEKEEKEKEGGQKAAGAKMRRTTEQPKEDEKEKMVGGWQAVEQCEDLYVSLHAGEAWCPEDTEKRICETEEKEH